jgi:hypothetical protein
MPHRNNHSRHVETRHAHDGQRTGGPNQHESKEVLPLDSVLEGIRARQTDQAGGEGGVLGMIKIVLELNDHQAKGIGIGIRCDHSEAHTEAEIGMAERIMRRIMPLMEVLTSDNAGRAQVIAEASSFTSDAEFNNQIVEAAKKRLGL